MERTVDSSIELTFKYKTRRSHPQTLFRNNFPLPSSTIITQKRRDSKANEQNDDYMNLIRFSPDS